MSFFPFDNEDEDDGLEYNGDIEKLVADYESRKKDEYSASELLFIFRLRLKKEPRFTLSWNSPAKPRAYPIAVPDSEQ